ncbi:MAG: phasin family protein [Alphaproteobacteria bacterium]|nr:phasin family protein [Alphaproteobacteria bacterium]
MPTQNQVKKPSIPSPSKPKEVSVQALDISKQTAANSKKVVNMSASAVQNFFEQGASQFQDVQQKFSELSQEQIARFSKVSENASRSLEDALEFSKGNLEAVTASGETCATAVKTLLAESANTAGEIFSDNLETAKDFLTCRTVNDVFDLQGKIFRSTMDALFGHSLKVSELLFTLSQEAVEPVTERLTEASERLSKTLTEAA